MSARRDGTAIEARGLEKRFGDTAVLRATNFAVETGETIVLLGASGCGKTTLLRLVAGLETASAGEIWLRGANATNIPPRTRGVAMVFQSYALYPHMSVSENILFGLRSHGVEAEAARKAEQHALETLAMTELRERRPSALSGGQKQRVAIARLLAKAHAGIADIFLLDEPLSNLDAQLRERLRTELRRLFVTLGRTTLYVTHDQVEAMTIGDKIAIMNAGVMEQIGTPSEVWGDPKTLFVAEFLGQPRINTWSSAALSSCGDGLSAWVSRFPAAAVFALRPQHFSWSESPDALRLAVTDATAHMLGGHVEVRGKIAGAECIATLPRQDHRATSAFDLFVHPKDILAFDRDTGRRIYDA